MGALLSLPVNRTFVLMAIIAAALPDAALVQAAIIRADPSNYRSLVKKLKAGDTLSLAPGTYPRLFLAGLNGTPSAWIAITGPDSGPPAVRLSVLEQTRPCPDRYPRRVGVPTKRPLF